jgi:phospholipid transport system substrate-binding protein
MKRFFAAALSLAATLLSSAPALAQEAPDAMMRRVSDEVLTIVRQDPELRNGNTQKIVHLVDTKVLPYFNFERMTALAVGRDWRKASAAQKSRLVGEFRTLLVRTYSNAFDSYRDETIEFLPFSMNAGDSEVTVKTQVRRPGRTNVQIHYDLEKTPQGWRVFDVIVAGVSLVTNYRDTFSREIRNSGVDGLIDTLAAKNKALVQG